MDSSALIAILEAEEDAARFAGAIADADQALLSAASFAESGIVMLVRRGPAGRRKLEALVQESGIRIEEVTAEQSRLAVDAFELYGKGRGSKAALNFGNCFAYALARATGLPLLFKGSDFEHTDIQAVP